MKRILFSLVLTFGAFAQAGDVVISGVAPTGASIRFSLNYESQSSSLFCSHSVLDEGFHLRRYPDVYKKSVTVSVPANGFAANLPATLSKCDAELTGILMDVTFAPSQLTGSIHLQMSANNISETQRVQCETKTYEGATPFKAVLCDKDIVVGADGKANVEITLK